MKLRPGLFFFRNSLADQRLLMSALALVCAIRLGLWVMPFRTLSEIVAKITSRVTLSPTQPQDLRVVGRVASSVRRASRYFPAASCLTQALATQILLARTGQFSTLRIGVTKGDMGELKAHAWVESFNGGIIIGSRPDLHHYTVLNRLEEVSL